MLGGASCVWDDAAAAWEFKPDLIVACNDIGTRWADRLDVWCTLHPEKMAGWRRAREQNGHASAIEHVAHAETLDEGIDRIVEYRWPGQAGSASSGGFAAKVALELAETVILAGVPMTATPHFDRASDWADRNSYLDGWKSSLPHIRGRVASMSGWTRELLGPPPLAWKILKSA